MYQEFYRGDALLRFPIYALILFMVVFFTGSIRAWRRGRATEDIARIPLSDDLPPQGTRHV